MKSKKAKGEKVNGEKLYKCPEYKRPVHSIGRYGKKWRCANPDCPVSVLKNLDPVKAGASIHE